MTINNTLSFEQKFKLWREKRQKSARDMVAVADFYFANRDTYILTSKVGELLKLDINTVKKNLKYRFGFVFERNPDRTQSYRLVDIDWSKGEAYRNECRKKLQAKREVVQRENRPRDVPKPELSAAWRSALGIDNEFLNEKRI